MGLFIHCREEGWLFEALFDLGSSGLRCRGCKSWCREKKKKELILKPQNFLRTPRLAQTIPFPSIDLEFCNIFAIFFAILTWYFAIFFATLTWNYFAVESTFSITDVWQQPLFVFDWTLKFLELEKMLQSCFYFWLILENRKIERAAIKDE